MFHPIPNPTFYAQPYRHSWKKKKSIFYKLIIDNTEKELIESFKEPLTKDGYVACSDLKKILAFLNALPYTGKDPMLLAPFLGNIERRAGNTHSRIIQLLPYERKCLLKQINCLQGEYMDSFARYAECKIEDIKWAHLGGERINHEESQLRI